ncbi:MAG: sigma factor, partial [Bacteroidota bacterium]
MLNKPEYTSLHLLKAGNKEGLEYLYSQYHGRIYAFCYRFFRQTELAEEATADVFVTLWKKRFLINPKIGIQALLYKIAKDTAFNYLKKIA